MAHQNTQRVACLIGGERLDRIAVIRKALTQPALLRTEAERLLSRIPDDCHDVLSWSTEGHAIALAAAVLGQGQRREVVVHRASLVAPLAPRAREGEWRWVCAEEILGLGPARSWAVEWASERCGARHADSRTALTLVS